MAQDFIETPVTDTAAFWGRHMGEDSDPPHFLCVDAEVSRKLENELRISNLYLEEVYQWLNEGPMDDFEKRRSLHRRIGDMLGKPRVTYGE